MIGFLADVSNYVIFSSPKPDCTVKRFTVIIQLNIILCIQLYICQSFGQKCVMCNNGGTSWGY